MSETRTVDARGLSCPQPAMLTRQALQKVYTGTIEVFVDSSIARENVFRLAKASCCNVTVENQPDGSYRIVLER